MFKEQPVIDLGHIKKGKDLEHSFYLKNESPNEYVITSARASCGCTTPIVKTGVLKPGQDLKVTIKATTKGRSGLFQKNIFINYTVDKIPKVYTQGFKVMIDDN